MTNEALDRKAPFEDIYRQRAANPKLYAGLQEDTHFTPRYPRPAFVDSATLGPELHPSLEGKVIIVPLTTGGISKKEQLAQFARKSGRIGNDAGFMLESDAYEELKSEVQVNMVFVRVGDLVPNPKGAYATREEIFGSKDDLDDQSNPAPFTRGKRSEFGLHLLPHQTPLDYLIEKGDDLKVGDPLCFATKTLAGRTGYPRLFEAERARGRLWLRGHWADPGGRWLPDRRLAFGLSQVTDP